MLHGCILGAGPAAFYAIKCILQKLPSTTLTVFEKRLMPFGLLRYGVAPDHPEVKVA